MKQKTISVLTLAVVLTAAILSGCGGKSGSAAPDVSAESETVEQEATVTPGSSSTGDEAGEKDDSSDVPMVGIVTYAGGIEDGAFNQSAWEGLLRLSGTTDCQTSFLETLTEGGFQDNMHKLLGQGCDLCWGVGYSCADALLEEAGEHPDISFAIVDYAYPEMPGNMTSVTFRSQESSFLAGFIAGCVTETGLIGFVGGEHIDVIEEFQYGYQAGAFYAAKKMNKDIGFEVEYAGTFTDSDKGRSIAEKMYDGGCDIVFHAAGETGMGVIEAAKTAGKYAVGVDKDQSFLAPDNVLTSVLKDVNTAVYQVSKEYLEGEAIGGRTISLGLKEDAVAISEGHDLYSDEIYEEAMLLRDSIAVGELVPPASEKEYEDFCSSLN